VLAIAGVKAVGEIAHPAIEIDHPRQGSLRCSANQASTLLNARHLLCRVNKGPKSIAFHPSQEVLNCGGRAHVPAIARIRKRQQLPSAGRCSAEQSFSIRVTTDDAIQCYDVRIR
jgi:hypothetical protein